MHKLTIQVILLSTIVIAGIFAFAPINQASTSHGTESTIGTPAGASISADIAAVKAEQQSVIIVSGVGTDIDDNETVVIDCDQNFLVHEMYWTITDWDSQLGEELNIGDAGTNVVPIIIDGTIQIKDNDATIAEFTILNDGGTVNNVTTSSSWHANSNEEDLEHFPLILAAQGAGNNDIVLTLFDDGAKAIDSSDQLTVTAVIFSESGATCTVSVNTN